MAHNDSLLIVGGRQRAPRSLLENDSEWYDYQSGLLLRLDGPTGQVESLLEYSSPPSAAGPNDPVLFKSGHVEGDILYLCTQTEVMSYRLPSLELLAYHSLPCFNDVHHVRPGPDGGLLVASSGLELVLELGPDGQPRRLWNVLGEEPWGRFSPDIDYRRGISTKPHRAHPNFIFLDGEEIWCTRFEQKDALCLTRPERRINIGLERVHDGLTRDGLAYFTTVNGQVVIANLATLAIEAVIDLSAMHEADTLLGWCRGLYLADNGLAWVGFSRIRPTKFRQAVSWVRQGFRPSRPTHIGLYDLERRQCLAQIQLEEHGLNAVFSILPGYQREHHEPTLLSPALAGQLAG
jgi:hypothetical protein